MAKRCDADLFKVLIGQLAQNSEIYIVLSKALSVLGHAEFFEPVRNLLHCKAPSHVPCGSTYPIDELWAISAEVFCGLEWLASPSRGGFSTKIHLKTDFGGFANCLPFEVGQAWTVARPWDKRRNCAVDHI